jgi:hypothetical protein
MQPIIQLVEPSQFPTWLVGVAGTLAGTFAGAFLGLALEPMKKSLLDRRAVREVRWAMYNELARYLAYLGYLAARPNKSESETLFQAAPTFPVFKYYQDSDLPLSIRADPGAGVMSLIASIVIYWKGVGENAQKSGKFEEGAAEYDKAVRDMEHVYIKMGTLNGALLTRLKRKHRRHLDHQFDVFKTHISWWRRRV